MAWVCMFSRATHTPSHDSANCIAQPTPSLAKRNILARKMLLAVLHAPVWPLAYESGCTGGDTPGASGTALSASIP